MQKFMPQSRLGFFATNTPDPRRWTPNSYFGAFLNVLGAFGTVSLLLIAIISYFDRQLLGNNMSFTLCSIHILFNSNEFHEFWMSLDLRNRCTKIEQNWAKSQANQPLLGRPAWHFHRHGPGFEPVEIWHNQGAMSQGLGLGSIGNTERP